jgi:hypothetical protein
MAKKMLKGIPAQEVAGLAVGAVVAAKVAGMGATSTNETLKKVYPVLPLVLGIFLMKRKGLMASIGQGMAAVGATKTLGMIAPNLGIGASEGISEYTIEGASDYALSGMEVEGINESISGARSYALAGVDTNTDLVG